MYLHLKTNLQRYNMATTQRNVFEMTAWHLEGNLILGPGQYQLCAISGFPIKMGAKVAHYDQAEYDAAVIELSIALGASEDVVKMILNQTPRGAHSIGQLCLYEMFFSKNQTRSGRLIKPVMRMGDRKEFAGSGFAGADHYDRGYDRGIHKEHGYGDSLSLNTNLHGFVVADDAPVMKCNQQLSDEEDDSSEWSEEDDNEWEGDGMVTEEESEYEEEDDESTDMEVDNQEEEEEGIGCNKCYACVSGGSHPCQGPDPDYYDADGNPLEDEDYCHGCESGADCMSAHSDACNRERGFM